MSEMIHVVAASYDRVEDALADFEAIDAAYRHISKSHDFDATVIARDAAGKVEIVRRHDEHTRHSTGAGFGWGFAIGAVAALFPRSASSARSPPARAAARRWAPSRVTRPAC